VIAGLHLLFTLSLAVRGGLLAPAQGLHPVAVQMPGYLWPLYYFIGVGIIFKVLRQTKLIHGTMQELVPPRVLVPLGLIFLLGATAVGWSDVILLQPGRAWLPGLEAAAEWITGLTPWLWRQPLWGMTMEWMRWAFAIVLALAVWAAVRRRLNGEVMAMLLFATRAAVARDRAILLRVLEPWPISPGVRREPAGLRHLHPLAVAHVHASFRRGRFGGLAACGPGGPLQRGPDARPAAGPRPGGHARPETGPRDHALPLHRHP
jgi:hypothetical protein